MRTHSAQSAEFYEAVSVPGVTDGTLMFRMSIQPLSDSRNAEPIVIDTHAEDSHKKHYPKAWKDYLRAQELAAQVAVENQAASIER